MICRLFMYHYIIYFLKRLGHKMPNTPQLKQCLTNVPHLRQKYIINGVLEHAICEQLGLFISIFQRIHFHFCFWALATWRHQNLSQCFHYWLSYWQTTKYVFSTLAHITHSCFSISWYSTSGLHETIWTKNFSLQNDNALSNFSLYSCDTKTTSLNRWGPT